MVTTDTAVPGADRAVDRATAERLVREQFRVIETGDAALAAANMTDGYVNHQAGHEPLAPAAAARRRCWPPAPGCAGRSAR